MKNSWISVEERIPEVRFPVISESSEVLVITENEYYYTACFNHLEKVWIDTVDNVEISSVTHWQPMEPPPTPNKVAK